VAGLVEDEVEDGEGEVELLSVLDLLSDDAAGLASALPPSPFGAPSFDADSVAFLRASDG
jgi:hypothetical protein